MVKFYFFLLIFITSVSVKSQVNIYGQEHFWASPYQLIETDDHGFVVVYEFQDYQGSPLNSAILKVDVNGNLLWKKLMGNDSKHLQLNGIAKSPDGGYVLSGWTCLIDDYSDPFILKVNSCFETEWCKIYKTNYIDDLAGEIVQIPGENAYITYFFYNQNVHERISIIKIDLEGNTIWKNNYSNNPIYISELALGLGYSEQDTSVLLRGIVYAYEDSSSMYALQPYWLKVDTDGFMQWEIFHIPDSSFTYGVSARKPIFLQDSNIILPATQIPSTGKLIKINSEGNFKWLKTLHHPDTVLAVDLNSTAILNNNIYVGAQYFVTGEEYVGYASIIKNDTSGNFISQCIIPTNFTSVIYSLLATSDSKLVISASHDYNDMDFMLIKYNEALEYDTINSQFYDYDSLCPYAITPDEIEMNCDIVTDVTDLETGNFSGIKFAPNPADLFTIITLPETITSEEPTGFFNVKSYRADYVKELKLAVYNINGRLVYASPWPDNTKEKVLFTSDWEIGMYLIKITKGEQLLLSGKLMVK